MIRQRVLDVQVPEEEKLDETSRLLPRYLPHAVALALLGLALVLWQSEHRPAPFYYALMTGLGVWQLGGSRWQRVQAALQQIPLPTALKVVILGYGAVIAEETLVGTLYALNEGFTFAVWRERVGQFVAFNLLAFTGAIAGLGIAYSAWPGLRPLHVWIAGLWGLFAEGTIMAALGNPVAAALVAPPNIAVYAIILAPLMLSLPDAKAPLRLWHIPATWALMFVLSLGPVAALQSLRAAHPEAFPRCDYIRC